LFLVHFPVLVLVLCVWTWLGWLTPMGHVAGLLSTYALSLLAANLFYRHVETPAARVSREFA
jgi:peptidoglycan/LPS O-acetylase OafA/YrhL